MTSTTFNNLRAWTYSVNIYFYYKDVDLKKHWSPHLFEVTFLNIFDDIKMFPKNTMKYISLFF